MSWWKILFFLIFLGMLFFSGLKLNGYDFVYSRGSVLCLSCMGLEE
ncbi:hypothetical protein [Thermodesulfobacterium hveragerdense]|nr:hypothetical protein [Thermodesulfobacterium hveragerdense]